MGTEIRVSSSLIPHYVKLEDTKVRRCVDLAEKAAARLLMVYLRKRADELKITDLGTYKRGLIVWDKTVIATAPHSGIVELGARPHKVSLDGIIAIAFWVRRKLRQTYRRTSMQRARKNPEQEHGSRKYQWDEAFEIAWAIAKSIEKRGQAPRYVMRDSLPKAREFMSEELARRLLEVEARDIVGGTVK